MSVAFDTLKFARALRDKANMSAEQAEGVAEAFSDATSEQLATKADLDRAVAELRAEISGGKSELQAEISGGKSELQAEISSVKSELQAEISNSKSELRAEIAAVRSELVLVRWMIGFALALLVAVFGKLFLR